MGLIVDPDERKAALAQLTRRVEHEEEALDGFAQALDAAQISAEYQQIFRYQRMTLDCGQTAHCAAGEWFRRALEAEDRGTR